MPSEVKMPKKVVYEIARVISPNPVSCSLVGRTNTLRMFSTIANQLEPRTMIMVRSVPDALFIKFVSCVPSYL